MLIVTQPRDQIVSTCLLAGISAIDAAKGLFKVSVSSVLAIRAAAPIPTAARHINNLGADRITNSARKGDVKLPMLSVTQIIPVATPRRVVGYSSEV